MMHDVYIYEGCKYTKDESDLSRGGEYREDECPLLLGGDSSQFSKNGCSRTSSSTCTPETHTAHSMPYVLNMHSLRIMFLNIANKMDI